jgi:hypothetical protein
LVVLIPALSSGTPTLAAGLVAQDAKKAQYAAAFRRVVIGDLA